MITKDIIPIFNTDTFLEGIKSDSNVSMYEIKSPEYNPPTPCGGNIEIGEILAKQSFS